MATTRPLPIPGPDPSKTYVVRLPPPVPGKPVSQPGDIVTVSVTHSSSTTSQTISFILAAKQALPWLDYLATNISVSATVTLHDSDTQVVCLTLNSLTRPTPTTSQSLCEEAEALRQEGNAIFKRSEDDFRSYKSAILHYGKAADRCRVGTQDPAFLAKMYSNIALASLRACENTAALSHTDVSDSLAKNDPRVLYRRALAYAEFDHPVRALAELNHAAAICPTDPLIKRERDRVSTECFELLAKRRQHFAEVYNVMLLSPIFTQPLGET